MHIPYIFGAVAAMASLAAAQEETSYTSKPTGTATSSWSKTATTTASSTSGPPTHSIAVGAEGNVFSPNTLKANVGDIIRFVFYPSGHSVARSAFKFPCIPYEYSGLHRTGFWSGTKTPQAATGNVWFDVTVNDTEPIFYYCAAPGSCVDHHMIGVVNPSENETFDAQMEYVERVQFQLKPGDPWPSETAGEQPSETNGYGSGGNNSQGGSSSGSQDSNGGGGGLSAGAIAGIAIGGAAVLVLAAALIYLCGRRGGFDKAYRKSVAPAAANGNGANPSMMESNHAAAGIPQSANPKSPGQASFSTYSGAPDHDPYRSMTTSPHNTYYNGSYNGSPPPPGAVMPYPPYPPQGHYSPQMTELSATQHSQHQSPVELPTTVGAAVPGSPPPQYPTSARRDSWTAGGEGGYRPGNK